MRTVTDYRGIVWGCLLGLLMWLLFVTIVKMAAAEDSTPEQQLSICQQNLGETQRLLSTVLKDEQARRVGEARIAEQQAASKAPRPQPSKETKP